MKFLSLVAIIAFLVLGGCTNKSDVSITEKPANQAECERTGGNWVPGSIPPPQGPLHYVCSFPTADAGKRCTDTAECESQCIAESEESVVGQCSEWTKWVSGWVMRDGKAQFLYVD